MRDLHALHQLSLLSHLLYPCREGLLTKHAEAETGTRTMIPQNEHDDAATLRDLRADFPHLDISIEFLATYRAWSARGRNGRNPWLVLSTDVQRFRRTLDHADWPF
jgi:hypothetical protein